MSLFFSILSYLVVAIVAFAGGIFYADNVAADDHEPIEIDADTTWRPERKQ